MGKSKADHFLSLVWIMLLILPNNQIFYFFVPIAFILLYDIRSFRDKKVMPFIVVSLILLFLSILVNFQESYVTNKDYFRIAEIAILFFTFAKLRGRYILKPYIIFALLYIMLSQLSYLFNLSSITSFFEAYYPISEDYENQLAYLNTINLSNYGEARLGGLFHNANQFARYLQLITVTLLCEIKQFRKYELAYLFPLIIISILATGSRTSFIVLIAIGIGYLYFTNQIRGRKIIPYVLGITAIGIFFLVKDVSFEGYRALKVDEGVNNSLGVKVELFTNYLNQVSEVLPILFGNMSADVLAVKYGAYSGTDFDLGDIFILFGLLFYICLLSFYLLVYGKLLPQYKIIFAILIWMFSSSILCSYRMAPLFFLVMGVYYQRSIQSKINTPVNEEKLKNTTSR